jgi:hypothetical protein
MSTRLFLGGMPFKPDVDKLRAAFGVPKEGDVIPWDRIEGVIGQPKKSNRFVGVVTAWRKALYNEHNVAFGPERGLGLRVLNPDERIQYAAAGFRMGCRKLARSARLAERTDPAQLTSPNVEVQKQLVTSTGTIRATVAASAKQIRWPNPVAKRTA